MANFGGFLSALGAGFGGYAKDQDEAEKQAQLALQNRRQSSIDAQNAQLHSAQMTDFDAQAKLRDQQTEDKKNRVLTLQRDLQAAYQGDTGAQARVVAADPTLAPQFMPKAPAPKYGAFGSQEEEAAHTKAIADAGRAPQAQWASVPNAFDPVTKRPLEQNRITGEWRIADVGALQPRGSGGGGAASGQTMGMLARVAQVRNDLKAADPEMSSFENPQSPMNVNQVSPIMKGKITLADQQPSLESRGAMGAFGNFTTSLLSGAAQQSVNDSPLGREARVYGTNVKRTGLGLAEINPRPNNALIGIETALSSADLGNNPEQTKIVQARRRNATKSMDAILSMSPAFVEAMQAQDPDWINNTIHHAITTGAMPSAGGQATVPGAAHPLLQKYGLASPTAKPNEE